MRVCCLYSYFVNIIKPNYNLIYYAENFKILN